jgi:hypothetical protein
MSKGGKDARAQGDRGKHEPKSRADSLGNRTPDELEDDERPSFIRELTPPKRIDVEALSLPLPGNPGSKLLGKDASALSTKKAAVLSVETYRSLPTPETWPDLFLEDGSEGCEEPLDEPSDHWVPWSNLLPDEPSSPTPSPKRSKPGPQKK